MHSLQSNAWKTKHTYTKMACLWSYPWQEQIHSMYWSTTTSLAKMNIMLRICQKYFIAKVEQDWVLHNYKQGREWINYNNRYKTSLMNISKICMYLYVASSLHGNKITADKDLEKSLSLKSETLRSLVCMLVLVTTEITKTHGIHPWKYGMAYNKTHVELMPIRCTD